MDKITHTAAALLDKERADALAAETMDAAFVMVTSIVAMRGPKFTRDVCALVIAALAVKTSDSSWDVDLAFTRSLLNLADDLGGNVPTAGHKCHSSCTGEICGAGRCALYRTPSSAR